MSAELLAPYVLERPELADHEVLRRAAATALSVNGGRPWRLWPTDRGVELRADAFRRMSFTSPGMQAILISAGAALLNMRLTIAALGNRPVTSLLPDRSRPGLLAVLRRGAEAAPTPAERALYDVVPMAWRDCPNTCPHPVPPALRHLVRRAAEAERVWLRCVVDPADRDRLVALVPSLGSVGSDGLLAVIGSNHDLPAASLHVGQAVQRVVLTAAVIGLVTSVVAWPTALRVPGPLPEVVGRPGHCPRVILMMGLPAAAHAGRTTL
jgi:hypothetical protein